MHLRLFEIISRKNVIISKLIQYRIHFKKRVKAFGHSLRAKSFVFLHARRAFVRFLKCKISKT